MSTIKKVIRDDGRLKAECEYQDSNTNEWIAFVLEGTEPDKNERYELAKQFLNIFKKVLIDGGMKNFALDKSLFEKVFSESSVKKHTFSDANFSMTVRVHFDDVEPYNNIEIKFGSRVVGSVRIKPNQVGGQFVEGSRLIVLTSLADDFDRWVKNLN